MQPVNTTKRFALALLSCTALSALSSTVSAQTTYQNGYYTQPQTTTQTYTPQPSPTYTQPYVSPTPNYGTTATPNTTVYGTVQQPSTTYTTQQPVYGNGSSFGAITAPVQPNYGTTTYTQPQPQPYVQQPAPVTTYTTTPAPTTTYVPSTQPGYATPTYGQPAQPNYTVPSYQQPKPSITWTEQVQPQGQPQVYQPYAPAPVQTQPGYSNAGTAAAVIGLGVIGSLILNEVLDKDDDKRHHYNDDHHYNQAWERRRLELERRERLEDARYAREQDAIKRARKQARKEGRAREAERLEQLEAQREKAREAARERAREAAREAAREEAREAARKETGARNASVKPNNAEQPVWAGKEISNINELAAYYNRSGNWRQRAKNDMRYGTFYRQGNSIRFAPHAGTQYTPKRTAAIPAAQPAPKPKNGKGGQKQGNRTWQGKNINHLAPLYGNRKGWRRLAIRDLNNGNLSLNGDVNGKLSTRADLPKKN